MSEQKPLPDTSKMKQVSSQVTYWKPINIDDFIEGVYMGSKSSIGMNNQEKKTALLVLPDQTMMGLPSNSVI